MGAGLPPWGPDNRLYVWDLRPEKAELHLVVGVLPSRTTVGDAARRNEHASWLDWLSSERIAIATASAAITVLELDPAKWFKRIEALAVGSPGS